MFLDILNYDYISNMKKIHKFYISILIKSDGKNIFKSKFNIVIINNNFDNIRYYGLKQLFSKLEVIEILKNNNLYKDCYNTVYVYDVSVKMNNYTEWFELDDNINNLKDYLM